MGAMMCDRDRELTFVALGVCPLLLVAIGRLNRRITAAAGEMRERESEVYGVVQRAMQAMRVIQAFTREDEEHRRFMSASERGLDAGLRLYTLQTFYSGVVNPVVALGTAAGVWVGSPHVPGGRVSTIPPGSAGWRRGSPRASPVSSRSAARSRGPSSRRCSSR